MKIIDAVSRWIVNRAITTTDVAQWRSYGLTASTASGISINNDNALQVSTVFACIRAISEDIAKLPLKVFQDTENGKEYKSDHSLSYILKERPNPYMTSMAFREALTSHVLGYGNGYALIDRNSITNEVLYLWPLSPESVALKRNDSGFYYYEIKDEKGNLAKYSYADILHIKGLGFNGLTGYNVIQYARESLGSAKAAEKFGAKFFANGANVGGVFEVPGKLSDKAYDRLKTEFSQAYSGDNAHKTLIAEEGMKFSKASFSPDESQFLETKQFTVAEICRWFRMPPHKVADTTRAQGWSTIEQTNIDYVTDTLMPWMVRWEQAINSSLLRYEEKEDGYYVKHIADALLRGDTSSRYNAYAIGRQWGWLSVNDIRSKEDMNPIDGGDKYLTPLNMTDNSGNDNAETDDVEVDNELDASTGQLTILIADAAARIANAEKREIGLHLNKKNFTSWVDSFYKRFEKYCVRVLLPITKASNVIAGQMISENRFKDGDDFNIFSETIETKHREFINANI